MPELVARLLGHLGACVAAGVVIGRVYGAFLRAPFHHPLRLADVSPSHRALLAALDVVEWPALFVLTLAVALVSWRWLKPRGWTRAAAPGLPAVVMAFLVLLGLSLIAVLPEAAPQGRPLVFVAAAAGAATAASAGRQLWIEARGGGPSFIRRTASQLPLLAGHFAATCAATASLGFRGENALAQGIALLVGAGLFVAEVACAVLIAAVCGGGRFQRASSA